MPQKIKPIRIQENRCIFDGITRDLFPLCTMHCALRILYVTLIVLDTVFSMAWYKIVMQYSLVVDHRISHLSLVFTRYTHSFKGSCVYQE